MFLYNKAEDDPAVSTAMVLTNEWSLDMDTIRGNQGLRRQPVYLFADNSASMDGEPIDALNKGMAKLQRYLQSDLQVAETAVVSVISFNNTARVEQPLASVSQFRPMPFHASGGTLLDTAFTLLNQQLDLEIIPPVLGGSKGDYRPLVFVLTDGCPNNENWRAAKAALLNRKFAKPAQIIAIGCGPRVDDATLTEISTGIALRLNDLTEVGFHALFLWVTDVITQTTRVVTQTNGMNQGTPVVTPNSPYLQMVPMP